MALRAHCFFFWWALNKYLEDCIYRLDSSCCMSGFVSLGVDLRTMFACNNICQFIKCSQMAYKWCYPMMLCGTLVRSALCLSTPETPLKPI